MIDAHIHLQQYSREQQQQILGATNIEAFIAVASDLATSKETYALAQTDARIKAAFGFHPEQALLSTEEEAQLFTYIRQHATEMIAIGEVGLPYYTKRENPNLDSAPYRALLERFIVLAKELDKPIILHAVYEDAEIACDLLEKHNVTAAHFHWFKGDEATTKRMANNGYYISFTPDICYEPEIQALAANYPLAQIMLETDGPWPFEQQFSGQLTTPQMLAQSLVKLSAIKKMPVGAIVSANTKRFYRL